MYERQIITQILEEESLDILNRTNLTSQDFTTAKEEIKFILDYHEKYDSVPSKQALATNYRDFQFDDLVDTELYAADKIKEVALYTRLAPIIKQSADLTREDSNKGIEFLKGEVDALMEEVGRTQGTGKDIVANSHERLEDYNKRVEMKGMLGVPSGIKQLDDITFGWLPEDLIVIFARTSEGKSWITLYLLIQAWLQGKKVLLYSGEMSHLMVGYRMDTYLGHFSNRGLMSGKPHEKNKYAEFIEDLSKKDGFIVVTPSDIGNRQPTTKDIEKLINIHKPDIVGIDQITLMDDWKRGENTRMQYGNITADLFNISERTKIPIIAVTQANRKAAIKNEDKENPESPKLHEIAESDEIARNSTRVIALSRVDNILKLSIEKNRYGEDKGEVLLNWQIDKGYISPLIEDEKMIKSEFGF